MKFHQEAGAIITGSGDILHLVMGEPGKTEFPEETIWNLHQKAPGSVYALAHVHPPGMSQLSGRDRLTMRTWARAMYPFPIRMTTITEIQEPGSGWENVDDYFVFLETCYLGNMEAKETWEARGKSGGRTFQIIQEWEKKHRLYLPSHKFYPPWHGTFIAEMAYQSIDKDDAR